MNSIHAIFSRHFFPLSLSALFATSVNVVEICKNALKMLFIAIKSICGCSNYTISHVDIDHVSQEFIEKLKTFEASFSYPFNERERFKIEHGVNGDYFAFFKQLGKVHYYVASCKRDESVVKNVRGQRVIIERKAGEIAAVGCGILRTVKTFHGKPIKAWYICDLKVGENYRGEHLLLRLVQRAAWRFFNAPRGFGICMNLPNEEPKAAEIWRKHGPLVGSVQTLHLYTLTAEQIREHRQTIESYLRNNAYMRKGESIHFRSTSGSKNYQIFNDNENSVRSWRLLHIQPGSDGQLEPEEEYVHMSCAVKESSPDLFYRSILGSPSSTAQVVSYGMEKVDFNCIVSNQI